MQRFDFIFAGGGVAGLSLAYHLVTGPFPRARLLLVDRCFADRANRVLSFWTAQPTPYEPIVARTWRRLNVAGPGFEIQTSLHQYRYQTIRALDFYQFVYDALDAAPGVTRLQGHVSRVEDGDGGATVWVGDQPYCGDWVFDSRFSRGDLQASAASAGRVCLWQHFQGWEVVTPQDRFDPQAATIMDLRPSAPEPRDVASAACPQGPWRFFYVLPYTARRALVELVSLRPNHADHTLDTYLGGVLGVDAYEVISHEAGAIPLSDYPFPRRLGRRVMAIGTKGGRVKPSTGYGFTRMQQDAMAIARSLQAQGHPFAVPGERPFYRFCDRLMLRMLARRGEWALPLFCALLQGNPLQRVLRFLDEQSTPLENLRLSASLVPRGLALARAARWRPDSDRRVP